MVHVTLKLFATLSRFTPDSADRYPIAPGTTVKHLLEKLGVRLDPRGNIAADTTGFASSEPGIFAAGDCRRGQSLVVWAIWEGREAARQVDRYLMGESRLQSRSSFV